MRTDHQAKAHALSHQCLRTAAIAVHQARQAALIANESGYKLACLRQLADNIERMAKSMRY